MTSAGRTNAFEVARPLVWSQPTDSTCAPLWPLETGHPLSRDPRDCTAAEPVHVQPCGQEPVASVSKSKEGVYPGDGVQVRPELAGMALCRSAI